MQPSSTRGWFQRDDHVLLLVRAMVCAVLSELTVGCTFYSSLDRDPGVTRSRVLGRRYVLSEPHWFEPGSVHLLPNISPNPRWVEVARGTILRTVHVERWHDPFFTWDKVQAVAENGPLAGKRVIVGFLNSDSAAESHDAEVIRPVRQPILLLDAGGASRTRAGALWPLPTNAPDWLDAHALPPTVRPTADAVLIASLKERDWVVRYYAVGELGRRAESDPSARDALASAVQDEMPEVRHLALDLLAVLGPKAAPEADAVLSLLARGDLTMIEEERALNPLLGMGAAAWSKMLKSPNSYVRSSGQQWLDAPPEFGPAKRQPTTQSTSRAR